VAVGIDAARDSEVSPRISPVAARSTSTFIVDSAPEGWGIGLSTCQPIVEAHGGRIGIDDSPLGGASVWVVLPD
jgi:signal transduction histidine kinase